MIITKVKMAPFAGVSNRELDFTSGLNVVLGDNEAGKSTLVNAIFALLFIPTHVKRNASEWKDYLARFLPVGGGDTVSVTAEFLHGADEYALTRSWGETRECRFVINRGAVMTKEETVKEHLSEILRYGKGTYENVLFARQDEMMQTVKLLRQNKEASGTLSDALRSTMFQAGGVSLDELAMAISDTKKKLISNWDVERDGPRNNRGIDDPHKKNVGDLLQAYYMVEELTRAVRLSRDAEERLETMMAQLTETVQSQAALAPKKAMMEKVEHDVHKRAALEPELRALAPEEETLKRVNMEWPGKIERLKHLAVQLEMEKKRHTALTLELEKAKAAVEAQKTRARYQVIKPLLEQLRGTESELSLLTVVSAEDVAWLEEQVAVATNREAELRAMKLLAKLSVQQPMQISVTSGLAPTESVMVDEYMQFDGNGVLRLTSAEWTLDIQSGQEDVETILTDVRNARESCTTKLLELGCKDVAEAKETLAKRNLLAARLSELRAKMDGILQGQPLAELEAAVADLPVEEPLRDPETIYSDKGKAETDMRLVENEIAGLQTQIQAWEELYRSFDAVMDRLADVKSSAREIQQQLAALAPLPEGYADAREFLAALQVVRQESQNYADAVFRQKIALAEAQSQLPEVTAEDLIEQLRDAKQHLARLKREASAALRVEAEFNRLVSALDQNTLDPFVESFSRYLSPATGYRYQAATWEGALPTGITATDGKELPVDLLSAGTTRGIALALRLAMAEFLLEDAQGFMVMDDPLVDLDPSRKEYAAAMLRAYAEKKQLIITTCDPETARLLAGNCIALN